MTETRPATPGRTATLLSTLLLLATAACGGSEEFRNPLDTTDLSDAERSALAAQIANATAATTTSTHPQAPPAGPVAFTTVAVNVPLSGSHPCQVSGHITYSGNVKGTADTVTGAWSVYGSATFQLGDPTNNLNDCRVTADVILGGTLYLTLAGNNAEGMGATLNGTITVNRRGATGGLSPRGSCFVMLTVPRGGTRATGSVCGHSVN